MQESYSVKVKDVPRTTASCHDPPLTIRGNPTPIPSHFQSQCKHCIRIHVSVLSFVCISRTVYLASWLERILGGVMLARTASRIHSVPSKSAVCLRPSSRYLKAVLSLHWQCGPPFSRACSSSGRQKSHLQVHLGDIVSAVAGPSRSRPRSSHPRYEYGNGISGGQRRHYHSATALVERKELEGCTPKLVRSDAQRRTIYALSTPQGKAGVGVIRISGPDALNVWNAMVRTRKPLQGSSPRPWQFHRCLVVNPGSEETLDEGLAVFFKGLSSVGSMISELTSNGCKFINTRT